jgi:hypothetical protein
VGFMCGMWEIKVKGSGWKKKGFMRELFSKV